MTRWSISTVTPSPIKLNLLALLAAASDGPGDLGRVEPAQSLSRGGDGPVRSQTAAPNSVSRSSYSLSQE